MEMCQQTYNRQADFYEHELFQPSQSRPMGLPRADSFEHGEQPVQHEDPYGGIELVIEPVDEVAEAIHQYGEGGHDGEPWQTPDPAPVQHQ